MEKTGPKTGDTQAINVRRESRKDRKRKRYVSISVRSLLPAFALSIIVIVAGFGGYFYFDYMDQWISTNNAHIEGRIYTVASAIPGVISTVRFDENQPVLKGDVLIELDSTMQKLAIDKVEAAIETNRLLIEGLSYVPERAAEFQMARAKHEELTLMLEEARILYGKTEIKSPSDGYVANLLVEAGEFVGPGQPLKYVVNNDNLWITANFTETQIRHIRIGQDVDIYVDAFPNESFKGRIASVMPAGGSAFALFPPDATAGNWVRTTQRIPVIIDITDVIDQEIKLRIGMLATVRVKR